MHSGINFEACTYTELMLQLQLLSVTTESITQQNLWITCSLNLNVGLVMITKWESNCSKFYLHMFASRNSLIWEKIASDLDILNGDLSHPSSLKNELKDWFEMWGDFPSENVPGNLLDALKSCDQDVYPCIHQLLIIGCTLPVIYQL